MKKYKVSNLTDAILLFQKEYKAIIKSFVKSFNGYNEVNEYLNKCFKCMYEGQIFKCNVLSLLFPFN